MASKHAQCVAVVKYNPHLNDKQVAAVAHDINTSIRTVRRAIREVREANTVTNAVTTPVTKRSKSLKKKKKRTSKKSSVTPGPFKKNANKKNLPPLVNTMGFEHFCKYHAYPYYDGLYRWQYQWFKEVWPSEVSLTKVARDHGKSIGHGNLSQWAMAIKGYDILYLGWTSRRREIADFVYTFFLQRGEIIVDKVSSNYHFKTTYGTRFDTYSTKSKEILGMHEMGVQGRQIIAENKYLEDFVRNSENPLLLIIDDAIDNTFQEEPSKETKLESFYLSTIISINPNKLMCVGTKKFEKDFYYFFEKTHEEDITVFTRTPFLPKNDPRYGKEKDNPCNLLCPERWIHEDDPAFKRYLKLKKKVRSGILTSSLPPKDQALVRKMDLMKKKRAMKEYWWGAEYMQDPHPVTGEIWEKVHYTKDFQGTAAYDLCCISIDRATTQKRKSDETGIIQMFRERGSYPSIEWDEKGNEVEVMRHNYLVTNDYTRKIRMTDLVTKVDEIYRDFIITYRSAIKLVIVVEKQGGGDDFCDLALDAGYRWAHLITRVHNTRNKWARIEDNLGTPITNANIRFLEDLVDSKVIHQIRTAPHPNHDDAIDALSNGYYECEKMPARQRKAKETAEKLKHYREQTPKANQWQQLLQQNRHSNQSVF